MNTLNALLTSRKVWVALLGVVTAVVSHYVGAPPEVWLPIEAFLMSIIVTITVEDAAEKRAGGKPGVT